MKGYGALVLRLTDEVVEALFVTYDLWGRGAPWGAPGVPKFLPRPKNVLGKL